jgi:hypothetical protein
MKLEDGSWPTVPLAAMRDVLVAECLAPVSLRWLGIVVVREAIVSVMMLAGVELGVAAQFSAAAAPAETVAASSPVGYTADLNYQETDEVLVSRTIGIKLQTAPFPKEPALPGQNVFRGSLLWGARLEQALPFICAGGCFWI